MRSGYWFLKKHEIPNVLNKIQDNDRRILILDVQVDDATFLLINLYNANKECLIKVLEKYGFEKDFIKWIKILIQNQESCIVNGGTTINYFKLEIGNRQGDPISSYLFIFVLEIVFLFTKESKKIYGLEIFDKTFLYTVYADNTTFFLKDTKSVIELMNIFNTFLKFSGLRPNKS